MTIDRQGDRIKERFETSTTISIFLHIANFATKVSGSGKTGIKEFRQEKLFKELKKRYKEAGWKCKVEYDDGLDGPNMSGPDCWVLTPKK